MTKDDLRALPGRLGERSDIIHWFSSSGTTGHPVVYPWTVADEDCARRTLQRIHGATDNLTGRTAFVIAPTGLPSMWAHMDRQLRFLGCATVFPGVDSAPMGLLELVALLKPSVLASSPLALSRLGELWRLFRTKEAFHPEILFVGGDVLSDARRRRLAALWDAEVRNFFGMSEIYGPLASETSGAGVLEWQADEVRVEVLEPATKQPVSEGGIGVAVYTTLWNRPAGLVRYWTGDVFKLVAWPEPGRPRFVVRGREGISLPALKAGYQPVDVDNILLSDPTLGTEWTAEACAHEVAVLCERSGGTDHADPATLRHLQACFCEPVRLEVVSPGSLHRSRNKLGQPELGHTLE